MFQIAKNVKEDVLGDTCTLPIHFSEDLDQEFKSYLAKLDVDLNGRLVEWLSLKGTYCNIIGILQQLTPLIRIV